MYFLVISVCKIIEKPRFFQILRWACNFLPIDCVITPYGKSSQHIFVGARGGRRELMCVVFGEKEHCRIA